MRDRGSDRTRQGPSQARWEDREERPRQFPPHVTMGGKRYVMEQRGESPVKECFRCGGRGHIAAQCPTPATNSSLEKLPEKKVQWKVNALRELVTDEGYELDAEDDIEFEDDFQEAVCSAKRPRNE